MAEELPPASVQDLLGDAGEPPVVEWNGERYRLSFPTQKVKAALEELVAARAVAECRAMKGVLPPDAYAELWNETVTAIQTRQHRTMGPLWVKTVMAGGVATAGVILFVLFRVRHPKLTEEDVAAMIREEPEQTTAALLRVIPPFFDLLIPAGARPEMVADLKAQLAAVLAGPSPPPTG